MTSPRTANAGAAPAAGDTTTQTRTTPTVWPHHELGRRLSNWGRWGADDELGTLNFVTPEKRVQAAGLVRTGKIFDLGMPFDRSGPQDGSFRGNPIHTMTYMPVDTGPVARDGMISADDMITMGLQCATQWDSLAHVGYGDRFYNDMPASAINAFSGATRNSFDKAMSRLISRGVLLDVARLKGLERLPSSYEITSADLEEAEGRQGVRVEPGDILLIRTGEYLYFAEGNKRRFSGSKEALEAGLGLDSLEYLHAREVAVVAMDNWSVEVYPSAVPGAIIPIHQVAIRDIGLVLGEMFNFEELAADCAADGVWEFMFSGVGLKVTGSVGSPVTPMALK